MPEGLVALHKHMKGSGQQQNEIDFAVERYSDGYPIWS